MKTQTFGIDHKYIVYRGWAPPDPLTYSPARTSAVSSYRMCRENGEEQDNPWWDFPEDGTFKWTQDWGSDPNPDCYYTVRYDEGPGDRKWMEEKDRHYLARLNREKEADQQVQTEARTTPSRRN